MIISSINIQQLVEGKGDILKPRFHLNNGKIRFARAKKKGIQFDALGSVTSSVYTGGIFKRMFVDREEFGVPYISAQHMMALNPLEDSKLISKRYTPRQDDMTLWSGQILVSCAGTIGNVRLVTNDLNGVIGSQDIIRVISNEKKISYRFIYTFLSTPTVHSYIQSFIYGSVVPRIEPKALEQLPFPEFKKETIEYVNQSISKVETFRDRALAALRKAHQYFDSKFEYRSGARISSVTLNQSVQFQSRLDASYNIKFREITHLIKNAGLKTQRLETIVLKAFIPNRGKRVYTKRGIRYLSSSDIFVSNPLLISRHISPNTPNISSMIVKKGYILIARSGQEILGSTQIVGDALNDLGVNEHALRLVVDHKYSHYAFAFLSSQIGNQYLRAGIFGSAILTIDDSYIKEMTLPILPTKEINDINELIKTYVRFNDMAIQEETDAINKVEKEIESWQQ